MKKAVLLILMLVISSTNTLSFFEPFKKAYVGNCMLGEMRCAGIAVQECIKDKWFLKTMCSIGKRCDESTFTCKSEDYKLPQATFTKLARLPDCVDGESKCERPHLFYYCKNKKWQTEECKPGFRCDPKKLGCKPFRPYMGIPDYYEPVKKSVMVINGKSKYQPLSIKRYTYINQKSAFVFLKE